MIAVGVLTTIALAIASMLAAPGINGFTVLAVLVCLATVGLILLKERA